MQPLHGVQERRGGHHPGVGLHRGAHPGRGTDPWVRRATGWLVAVPDVAPAAVAAAGIVALLAVVGGMFTPAIVVPLVAAAVVASAALVSRWTPHADARAAGGTVAAVVFAAGWVWWNLARASEYVVVDRDPGFIALQAMWLDGHASAGVPVGSAEAVADRVSAVYAETAGFGLHDGVLLAQGNKMVPALLAMMAWPGGQAPVLAGNLVLGAVALLAVYAAARRLVGPWWGLAPVVGLALSLPFLVFARAPYTEPLALALVWGSVAAVTAGLRTGSWAAWGSAALMIGAASAARVDGALAAVGLVVALAGVVLLTLGRTDRRAVTRRAVVVGGAAVLGWVLGAADVVMLSPEYAEGSAGDILAVGVLLAVAVAGLGVSAVVPRRLRVALWRRRSTLATVAAVTLALGIVALASRPLWFEGRGIPTTHPAHYVVELLQTQQGLPVDGTRSYDELSLSWMTWYLGLPTVVVAALALVLLVHRGIGRREPVLWLLAATVTVATAYYFVQVRITPDQIWAVRRLLPVALPGLLLAATWLVSQLGRGSAPRRLVAAAGAAAIAFSPVHAWDGFEDHVEHRGRYSQALTACDALTTAGASRVVWVHSSAFRYLATIRVVCDVEVVEMLGGPAPADLRAIRAAWGGGTVAVMTFDENLLPWSSAPAGPVTTIETTVMEHPLTRRPTASLHETSSLWLGVIGADGSVQPTPAP